MNPSVIMNPDRERRLAELISDDPEFILVIKNSCTNDNLWRIAIQGEASLFQYMNDPSEDMILFALSEDGANITYLKKMGIPLTPRMIYTAIKSYPGAIYLIPKDLRTERVREYACKEDPSLMKNMKLSKDFINGSLKKDPTYVRFLTDPTEDQICDALDKTPNACAYIHKFTPRIKAKIKALYPDLIPLIPGLSDEFKKDEE